MSRWFHMLIIKSPPNFRCSQDRLQISQNKKGHPHYAVSEFLTQRNFEHNKINFYTPSFKMAYYTAITTSTEHYAVSINEREVPSPWRVTSNLWPEVFLKPCIHSLQLRDPRTDTYCSQSGHDRLEGRNHKASHWWPRIYDHFLWTRGKQSGKDVWHGTLSMSYQRRLGEWGNSTANAWVWSWDKVSSWRRSTWRDLWLEKPSKGFWRTLKIVQDRRSFKYLQGLNR